jgi:glycosyltransferase involved in cell wall biosynthesis
MRVLLLSLAPPLPATNGHRLRNWGLSLALRAAGHDVHLLAFAPPAELSRRPVDGTGVYSSVTLLPLPPLASTKGLVHRLRYLPSSLPFNACSFLSDLMARTIRDLLAQQRFDLIVCDDAYLMLNLPEGHGVAVLLNKHDLTHVVIRRYISYERNRLKCAYARWEAHKVERLERWACRRATAVLACSENDRRLLQTLVPGTRIFVGPNVIDVDAYAPTPSQRRNRLVYVGAMDWLPNRDAAQFFALEILPILRAAIPELEFVVVGRNPTARLRQRFAGDRRIRFTGTVDDVRPELAAATVVVVPLRIGSGTRLKILEAAAMAKPIVSTRLGAEGLDFVSGEEILLADRPNEFAAAVADLLGDAEYRIRLGQAARQRVQRDYAVSALRARLEHALASLSRCHGDGSGFRPAWNPPIEGPR